MGFPPGRLALKLHKQQTVSGKPVPLFPPTVASLGGSAVFCYSVRKAREGSILQARSAGTALASAAVSRRLPSISAKTAGSEGPVP